MKLKLTIFFLLLGILCFSNLPAAVKNYTYPYDISQMEWQLLNWTSAWRQTTNPANPFTLERMEYDRSAKKVNIYLSGDSGLAKDEFLKKGMDGIADLFRGRFPEVDAVKDLLVHITLRSAQDDKSIIIEYKDGNFANQTEGTSYTWQDTASPNYNITTTY